MASSDSGNKTYTLHCHCNANIITLGPLPDLHTQSTIRCNCSLCHDRGPLIGYVPADLIKTVKGGVEDGSLSEYQFNNKIINWRFCKFCGSTLCGAPVDTEKMKVWGVNLRCIDGIDLEKLQIVDHNGKDS